jgi:predicted RNA polymerase sigma factor
VLLESLSPEQRAAFLLREVFDEPYDRIAEIVGTSEQNARQLATRARRHVDERRPRFEASREQREELASPRAARRSTDKRVRSSSTARAG